MTGIAVERTGSGPPLALIHGWGQHRGLWAPLVPLLAARRTVHLIDLPGHGASAPLGTTDARAWSDALFAALPARVDVCAWSLGAQLALLRAAHAPGSLGRLVLIGATPRFRAGDDWLCGSSAADWAAFSDALAVDPRACLRRFARLMAAGEHGGRRAIAALDALRGAAPPPAPEVLAAGLTLLDRIDLRAHAGDIALPTRLLHGEADAVVPLAAAQWLAARLPVATLEVVAGAGHAPWVAQPERIARCVLEHGATAA